MNKKPNETTLILGKRLRELRTTQGLGVREFAAKAGISHSSLLEYENFKTEAKASTIKTLAINLKTSSDYLLGIVDDSNPRKE